MQTVNAPTRMDAVQPPIVAVIGDLIRQVPGTISLGQGVVHYGPPPQVHERIAEFFRDPENHKYAAVQGNPALVEAFERKLKGEHGIDVAPTDRRVVVTQRPSDRALHPCEPGLHQLGVDRRRRRHVDAPVDLHDPSEAGRGSAVRVRVS